MFSHNRPSFVVSCQYEMSKVLVRSVESLYEGAKTAFRVGSELSEEFEVKVRMHRGSMLSFSFCCFCRFCH